MKAADGRIDAGSAVPDSRDGTPVRTPDFYGVRRIIFIQPMIYVRFLSGAWNIRNPNPAPSNKIRKYRTASPGRTAVQILPYRLSGPGAASFSGVRNFQVTGAVGTVPTRLYCAAGPPPNEGP